MATTETERIESGQEIKGVDGFAADEGGAPRVRLASVGAACV